MKNVLRVLAVLGLLNATMYSARAETGIEYINEENGIWPPEPGVSEIGPPDRHDFYIVPGMPKDTRHYIDPGPLVKPETPDVIILEQDEPVYIPPNGSPLGELPDLYAPVPDQRIIPVDDYIKDAFTGKLSKKCAYPYKAPEQGADENRGALPVEEATSE